MYNPAEGADYEFIEVQNIGQSPLDLRGVRFSGGIEFAFDGSDVSSLGQGELAVVVKNLGLFSSLYDTSKMKIAGEYAGRLDNAGEEVTLGYGDRLTILQFTYDDSWYSSTDGEGYSLVIIDPKGPRDRWSQKDGWRPSARARGSPGEAEPEGPPPSGPQRPGDVNQDGILNLSDAIGILGHLFLNSPASLPCGHGTLADPGNRALLDLDGDSKVNIVDAVYALRYLFQSGGPPALGTACTAISGCPEKCSD
jgi:hypothetical protein